MGSDQPEVRQPPTRCPLCDIELVVDFECGRYVVFKCSECGLNIRSFPPEPLVAFYEDSEESVDIDALLAAAVDRAPAEIDIPAFDLDSLGDGLG